MSRGQKQSFVGGLLAVVALALVASLIIVLVGRQGTRTRPSPSGLEEVDVNALAPVNSAQPSPTAQAGVNPASQARTTGDSSGPSSYAIPSHGQLRYDLNSILPPRAGQLQATVGNDQLDRVQLINRTIRFEVSAMSRAVLPLPPEVSASSFVAVLDLDVLSGQGAFTFVFHKTALGEQHAVQVYTNGTVEAVLFPANAGARSLIRPSAKVGSLSGATQLAVAVNGPDMAISVNGIRAGTASDGTLTQGGMELKAGGADRGPPLVLQVTNLRIYDPPRH